LSYIKFDCHTHTISSGHAYSTLEENVRAARSAGLEGLAITDHGPAMLGGPHEIYFMNLKSLPEHIDGIRVLRGIEANILDFEGKIDLSKQHNKKLDICLASYHEFCINPSTIQDHTCGWLAIIANPLVNVLGHPGRGHYPFDIDVVVRACRDYGKAMEINNLTLTAANDKHLCREIVESCIKHEVPVLVNSDAHFSAAVGKMPRSLKLLRDAAFPEELILNRNWETLQKFLQSHKRKV
jgi:putative hydrolase